MTILFHTSKKPKGSGLHFEYFHTAMGRTPPKGFNLRASITEDPLIMIYERIIVKDERRIEP